MGRAMNYLLIIGTFEAVFLILLLFTKRNKTRSDFYLGTMLAFYAISIFSTYIELYNFSHNYPFPKVLNLNWLVLFLHGPALWFYIKSLSESNFKIKAIYLMHFLPFIGFTIAHYFHFIQWTDADKITHMQNELYKGQNYYKIAVLCVGLSTVGYNFWALKLIRRYRQNLLQSFSKIEDIDLNWLRIFTIISLICYGVNAALFTLDLIFNYAAYSMLMVVAYGFASIYILAIGYFGLKHHHVFIEQPANYQPYIPDKKQIVDDVKKLDENNKRVQKVLSFIEREQPYLEPEITIAKLAELLSMKVETLSDILNNYLNQTFFDFINKYRIDEFKIQCLVDSNKHLSIMGIAYNCGFNSKATFYRAFKKFEGISPSAYMQSVFQKSETEYLANGIT